jgi:hypothetical protein
MENMSEKNDKTGSGKTSKASGDSTGAAGVEQDIGVFVCN